MISPIHHSPQLGSGTNPDRQIEAAAIEALSGSSHLALRQLNCRVAEGVVELTGTVSSFYLKQLAQAALQRVQPAGKVRNLIEVSGEPPKSAG